MKKPTRISLKKSLWSIGRDQPFDPGHFNSAKESIVESLAHLFGEQKRRALDWRRCQGLGQAWDSYRQLDADIIVNLLANPSLTGEAQDDTEYEVPLPVHLRTTQPLRQQDLPIHLRDTQPLTDPGWLGLPLSIKLKLRRGA